jgi:hypothetical protein
MYVQCNSDLDRGTGHVNDGRAIGRHEPAE